MVSRDHPSGRPVNFEESGLTKKQRLETKPVFRPRPKIEYQIMQEETPEALDGSTHFAFEHKVFRLGGCYFTADSDGDKPKFLMPLGDEMAAIAITALRQEFGIADGSNDGRLLDIVTKSLKYVQEIRPNDSIPQELLDGSAPADADLAEGGGALVVDHATGLSGNGGQGWSRLAPRSSAMAGTSRSNWPRWRCRGNCSGRAWA